MTQKHSKSRVFRIVVLTIGTFFAILFLLAAVPKLLCDLPGTKPEPSPGQQWEGQVMTAMFLVFILGYAIGWWRRLWGGIIILLAAFLVTVPFIIIQANYGSLIPGIPLFGLGILYVLLYLVEKRESVGDK